jgi:hypothetical protein
MCPLHHASGWHAFCPGSHTIWQWRSARRTLHVVHTEDASNTTAFTRSLSAPASQACILHTAWCRRGGSHLRKAGLGNIFHCFWHPFAPTHQQALHHSRGAPRSPLFQPGCAHRIMLAGGMRFVPVATRFGSGVARAALSTLCTQKNHQVLQHSLAAFQPLLRRPASFTQLGAVGVGLIYVRRVWGTFSTAFGTHLPQHTSKRCTTAGGHPAALFFSQDVLIASC